MADDVLGDAGEYPPPPDEISHQLHARHCDLYYYDDLAAYAYACAEDIQSLIPLIGAPTGDTRCDYCYTNDMVRTVSHNLCDCVHEGEQSDDGDESDDSDTGGARVACGTDPPIIRLCAV